MVLACLHLVRFPNPLALGRASESENLATLQPACISAHYIPVYLFNKAKSTLFLITDQQIHKAGKGNSDAYCTTTRDDRCTCRCISAEMRQPVSTAALFRSKLRRAIHQSKVYKRKCTLSYMFNAAYMIQGSTWLTQYQWKVCPFYLKRGRKLLIWPKTELIQFCMHYKFL